MPIYLSNRDGDGMTNEEGHYRFPSQLFDGAVAGAADVQVTENSPLGMSVLILTGDFKIDTGSGYAYMGWNSANAAVTIATADPANPRIDAIVLYVDKGAATSASPPNNPGIIKALAVAGTPGGVPVAPNNTAIQSAVGAGNPFIKLAEVRVNAAVTQITNANITDTRVQLTLPTLFVGTSSIQDGAITTAKIADSNVTTAKLADGSVTYAKMSTPVAFGAYQNASQSIAVATFTKVQLPVETFDNGSNFDSTTNYRFTVPAGGDGIYHFDGNVSIGSMTDTGRMFVTLYKNGSAFKRGNRVHASTFDTVASSVSCTLTLVAGDYIELFVWQNSGASKNTNGNEAETWLNGFRVR